MENRLVALRSLLLNAGLPDHWLAVELRRLETVEAHAARRAGRPLSALFEDIARDLERVALNVSRAHLAALEVLLLDGGPNAELADGALESEP